VYIFVLNRNNEIGSEKIKRIKLSIRENIAKKKKIEKKPLLISFLSVFDEKNLIKAMKSANEARAVKSVIVTDSCAQIP
jgi:hypothetical protein